MIVKICVYNLCTIVHVCVCITVRTGETRRVQREVITLTETERVREPYSMKVRETETQGYGRCGMKGVGFAQHS